ncbi:hypothetical protein ACWD6V_39620, partial [Streptomyces sp. NPDC005125]
MTSACPTRRHRDRRGVPRRPSPQGVRAPFCGTPVHGLHRAAGVRSPPADGTAQVIAAAGRLSGAIRFDLLID